MANPWGLVGLESRHTFKFWRGQIRAESTLKCHPLVCSIVHSIVHSPWQSRNYTSHISSLLTFMWDGRFGLVRLIIFCTSFCPHVWDVSTFIYPGWLIYLPSSTSFKQKRVLSIQLFFFFFLIASALLLFSNLALLLLKVWPTRAGRHLKWSRMMDGHFTCLVWTSVELSLALYL